MGCMALFLLSVEMRGWGEGDAGRVYGERRRLVYKKIKFGGVVCVGGCKLRGWGLVGVR